MLMDATESGQIKWQLAVEFKTVDMGTGEIDNPNGVEKTNFRQIY